MSPPSSTKFIQPKRKESAKVPMQPRDVNFALREWIKRYARTEGLTVGEVVNRLVELRQGLVERDMTGILDEHGLGPSSAV